MSEVESIDWRGLAGFEAPFARLKQLRSTNRLPPVLLLEGHGGIGKRNLAAGVAALYVCETGAACGECSACKEIRHFGHDDVFWLEEEKIKLEHAAEFQDHLQYNPGKTSMNSSGVRLAIAVDIDRMIPQAANRLLKTLEEPPPRARIILTTSRYQNLLDTIKSRCVKWHLRLPLELAGDLRTDLDDELARDLLAYMDSEQNGGALERAIDLQKRYNLSPAELVKLAELTLNKSYRSALTEGQQTASRDFRKIQLRRQNLQELHRRASREKIALNPLLSLESLVM